MSFPLWCHALPLCQSVTFFFASQEYVTPTHRALLPWFSHPGFSKIPSGVISLTFSVYSKLTIKTQQWHNQIIAFQDTDSKKLTYKTYCFISLLWISSKRKKSFTGANAIQWCHWCHRTLPGWITSCWWAPPTHIKVTCVTFPSVAVHFVLLSFLFAVTQDQPLSPTLFWDSCQTGNRTRRWKYNMSCL